MMKKESKITMNNCEHELMKQINDKIVFYHLRIRFAKLTLFTIIQSMLRVE